MKQTFFPLLCLLIFASGCAHKQVNLTKTGFLSNYGQLHEDEEIEGLHIYKNPNAANIENYSKIIIEPVEFRLDPKADVDIDEENKTKLIEYFTESLTEELGESYEVVSEPGEGVLLVRAAVTDLLPNKVYLNLHWSTTLYGAGIGGASIEAELIDSMTKERILAFIDARKGRRLNYTKGLTKWGHSKEVMGIWAGIIADNLYQLRERYLAETKEAAL